jgi:AraC family transcriptional regulator
MIVAQNRVCPHLQRVPKTRYIISKKVIIFNPQPKRMEPRIESIDEITLIGKKLIMSFANNKTRELWQSFMPKRPGIRHMSGHELYSVELYNDAGFFNNFDPTRTFEKWAAVKVNDVEALPEDMEQLIIPAGEYAVFTYRGKPSEAPGTYQYIYGKWIPSSEYNLDDRPHFALMGEKYKGEAADSEEEFWIPIRRKDAKDARY